MTSTGIGMINPAAVLLLTSVIVTSTAAVMLLTGAVMTSTTAVLTLTGAVLMLTPVVLTRIIVINTRKIIIDRPSTPESLRLTIVIRATCGGLSAVGGLRVEGRELRASGRS